MTDVSAPRGVLRWCCAVPWRGRSPFETRGGCGVRGWRCRCRWRVGMLSQRVYRRLLRVSTVNRTKTRFVGDYVPPPRDRRRNPMGEQTSVPSRAAAPVTRPQTGIYQFYSYLCFPCCSSKVTADLGPSSHADCGVPRRKPVAGSTASPNHPVSPTPGTRL